MKEIDRTGYCGWCKHRVLTEGVTLVHDSERCVKCLKDKTLKTEWEKHPDLSWRIDLKKAL